MKLRTRFVIVMAGFVLALTGLVAIVSTFVVVGGSAAFERDVVSEEVGDALRFLAAEAAGLSRITDDWASWDDTYDFIDTKAQAYVKANLVDGTFRGLRLNLVAFFDSQRDPVFVKAFDLDRDREVPPPESLWRQVLSSETLRHHATGDASPTGLLVVDKDIWLLASEPVLTSNEQGEPRGALVMARRLAADGTLCASWYERGRIALSPLPDGLMSAGIEVRASSQWTVTGSTRVLDIHTKPTVRLDLTLKRNIFARGLANEIFLVACVLTCGAVVGLFAFLIIDRWVLRKLSLSMDRLRTDIVALAADAAPRPQDQPKDEMGELSVSIRRVIEALKRRQRELLQAQKMAAMGTLVAGVAHEVNNPNSVISLDIRALQRRLECLYGLLDRRDASDDAAGESRVRAGQTREEIDGLMSEMRDASNRIAALVAALKSFARPASARMDEEVAVDRAVQDACDLLRHQIEKKRCRLSVTRADPLPAIRGNAQQLTQVMVNLIQNASEATAGPDAEIGVAMRWDPVGRCVVVTVTDHGSGIPAENLDRVFEPFFTTRREDGGMGLGLSISAEIVRSHGGRIDVQSDAAQGTRFTVALPAQREEKPAC